MPSADEPRRRPKRLVRRVAIASALAAAIGGATAAVTVGMTAGGLFAAHEEQTLRHAAARLADEVIDEAEDDDDGYGNVLMREEVGPRPRLADALTDELSDVELPDARARIDGAAGWLAGDRALPRLAIGACERRTLDGRAVRGCTVPMGAWSLTLVTSAHDAQARQPLIAWSALIGILVGALIGGFASHRAAVWALGPLETLSARVRSVQPNDPRPEVLAPALEHEELETLRDAIVLLVAQLRDSLESARGFAAQAAHELRTPLTTIAGELELLAETARSEDADAIEASRRRVADLVTLVQRLLILAQPGELRGSLDAVDLADVLDAVERALPESSRARLETSVDDDVLVRGDPALLGALLTNALDNALKFSEGAVRVTIRGGAEARIEVRDHGPGIAAEELEHVFAPFYRSAAARRSTALGHGVGLALIAHVAKVHGGRATIDSPPGEGTRLEVRLPVWTPRASAS